MEFSPPEQEKKQILKRIGVSKQNCRGTSISLQSSPDYRGKATEPLKCLSDSLSSLEDSDDDCPLHNVKKTTTVVLTVSPAVVLLDLPPSTEVPTVVTGGVIRLEEVEVQTDMGQLKCHDVQSETEFLKARSIGFSVDLPPLSASPDYTEPALEVMLRYLSVQIHQKQQWLQPNPTEAGSFCIKPATKGTQRILRAIFNRKHKTFVLLLRCGKDLILELRSFVNLLKSDSQKIDNFKADTSYCLESEGDHVAVLGGGSLAFFNVTTLEEKNRISGQDICSTVFFPDGFGYCTEKGQVFRIGKEGPKLLSPLLDIVCSARLMGSNYIVSVARGLQVAEVDSPLNYEFFEFKFEKMRLVSHSQEATVVFDKSLQICAVFSPSSARKPIHLIKFTSKEYTVDVAVYIDFLYSLTSGGVISRWKLFPTGRHIRELVLNAQLSHCKRLLLTSRQKFAIQTKEAVHFVIFDEKTVKTQSY